MLKGIKIRIYPNTEQVDYINNLLGCSRFVYNNCLALRQSSYSQSGTSLSHPDMIKHLVPLKSQFPFLKSVHSKVLQQSVRDLNHAYDNFFKHIADYPQFKRKHEHAQSCRFPKDAFIGVNGNRISLITQLKNLLFKCSREDERYLNKHQDKVSSVTLKKHPNGTYTLSVLIDKPNKQREHAQGIIGIDLGIKQFVTTSDGEVFPNPCFKRNEARRLKRLHREVSKKEKGSKNRDKARVRLAKEYERISNRKHNYLHEVSNRLINENQVIVMEDLNVSGMGRNHNLAEAIHEVNFGEFRRMMEYKAKWYGRGIVYVGKYYPSSKTCSKCGYINKGLRLSDREWVCPVCGERHDRDENAAVNILAEGRRIIGLSSPEYTLVDCPTVDDRHGDMVLKSSDRVEARKK